MLFAMVGMIPAGFVKLFDRERMRIVVVLEAKNK
jgi:hypothetical protein